MEDAETGFDDGSAQVRNIRDPGQPTVNEHPRTHDHTSTLQIMVQILCDVARRKRAAGDPMLKTTWRECLMCQWTVGFLERGNPRIV